MKIPHSFQLQGRTIEVVFDNERCNSAGAFGLADLNFNKILLANSHDGKDLPSSMIQFTLLHEVIHFVLDSMGEEKLGANEKFVDQMAGYLHQILETSKYDGN